MDDLRWGDVSSDDESEVDPQFMDDEVDLQGTGHRYAFPIRAGMLLIETSGDLVYNADGLRSLYVKINSADYASDMWDELYADLTDLSDPDGMDLASRELMMYLSDVEMAPFSVEDEVFQPSSELDVLMHHEQQTLLAEAMRDLALDGFGSNPRETHYDDKAPISNPNRRTNCNQNAMIPPLAPVGQTSAPTLLRFSSKYARFDCSERVEWLDLISEKTDMINHDHIDLYTEQDTITSRSNTRPTTADSVYLVYGDGRLINVGSHGYRLIQDIDFPLDFSGSDLALSELFSAPGGEGLTTPTPSHILHQCVSSLLSMAIQSGAGTDASCVTVEDQNIDILVDTGLDHLPNVAIDITTSSGIFNKKLRPDNKNPNFRYQAAISKYDIASCLSPCLSDEASRLVVLAAANSLACEYPGYYRVDETDVPRDLALQSQIYTYLARMPKKQVEDLGDMCYAASIDETMLAACETNIHYQGQPWKEKRDILSRSISKLKSRNRIAFPPVPISEILPMESKAYSVNILGHVFTAGPYIIQKNSLGSGYSMDNVSFFLKEYPCSGIIEEHEAYELAELLDNNPLRASGMSHEGPMSRYSGSDQLTKDAVLKIYKSSAVAQMCEIRSDLVRSIYKNPFPKKGEWVQVYLYKGKVCAWYRARDNVNSADGYRIDWFAISKFEVAGSKPIVTDGGDIMHLWPRQRIRSQEFRHTHMAPRKLSLALFSMLEKARAAQADIHDIILAWERLAMTTCSSTYASGKLFLTCRYLSTTLGMPSSPFHEMGSKLVNPVNYADIVYLYRLNHALKSWVSRDQYKGWSPMLGLPRSYSQLESYWMIWIPSDFADTGKNMANCVMGLFDEARQLEDSMNIRCLDLQEQLDLLTSGEITVFDLRTSLNNSCSIPTNGKFGWSWIGSLASGAALDRRSSSAEFDRRYGRGIKSKTLCDHLTVRHSARINKHGRLEKGTVAEMMIQNGCDIFLSTVEATFRFLYSERPVFFNHPKKGEHKEREISITDPDSRICLSDAEQICGAYGKTTSVDFLKDPGKNHKFYRTAARILSKGGAIQSSDATRYGPYMSNFAIAIMLIFLGAASTHLKWCSVVYGRLAYRQMLVPTAIEPSLSKMSHHDDVKELAVGTLRWMEDMPIKCYEDGVALKWYCTSHHMGQGMSHHSSSLLHSGGLIVCADSISKLDVTVSGIQCCFKVHIMVTSDDSTLLIEPYSSDVGRYLTRRDLQVASRIFLQLLRSGREIGLRMVSVKPNLVKEMISSIKGEFNSQDTGIGYTCPILGFRELLSLVVEPSSPSLVGDYLNAHACARDIAFAGQGLSTGNAAHWVLIDCIEERWSLDHNSLMFLSALAILPKQLTAGTSAADLVSSPAAWLNPHVRAKLLRTCIDHNSQSEDLDPHLRDSVFSPLMHIKVSMSSQHRKALSTIKTLKKNMELRGMTAQAQMIDDTLRSTMSSAKTRNMGRIAMRVRNRAVSPRPYLDTVFDKGTMLNATLNWLKHIDEEIVRGEADASDIYLGNSIAGHVRVVSRQRFGFPRPPQTVRYVSPRVRKPCYREKYGETPFGRHAIIRSGTSIVEKIGPVEREVVQVYLARMRYRKVSEHIEYGGTYVSSWTSMECCKIVSVDLTGDVNAQCLEHLKWGKFDEFAIDELKTLAEEHPTRIVLALHRHDGMTGLWHAIHRGEAINVALHVDVSHHDSNAIAHTLPDGREVLLALQGFDNNVTWTDSAPSYRDITRYQTSPYAEPMPSICRSVEDDNIRNSAVEAATYATELDIDGSRHFVYIAPEVNATPRQNAALLQNLTYLKARVIANLALGGYWHTSLRGSAFRAYIRGCFFNETIWTGGILGWRSSRTDIPTYYNPQMQTRDIKRLVIMGGIDNSDMLSPYNVDFATGGYKVMFKSITLTYNYCTRVGIEHAGAIRAVNFGQRFNTPEFEGEFLDMGLGEPRVEAMENRNEAMRDLYNAALGINGPDGINHMF